MPQPTLNSKMQFWRYRLATIVKSLKALYSLSPETVDAFVNSYEIYDHDWKNENLLIEKLGQDYYKEVKKKLIDWYSVLNHLCAIGQVEKMYIPPAMDLSASIMQNQVLFERKMANDLGLCSSKKALDIGCGRGRIAHHMASYTGADVTGINIDTTQLESAQKFAAATGRADQCRFQMADLNDLPLPFPDESFDAVYHVQVFSLSKDLAKLLKDVHRVLKPGGKFACLDWVCLDKYSPNDPHHVDLMRRIKPLIGAIGTPTAKEYTDLLRNAGFTVLIDENASIDGLQAPLIEKADKFYKRAAKIISGLVKCKLLPSHFQAMFDRLTKDGEAFVEADRLRIVTTSHYIMAQKK